VTRKSRKKTEGPAEGSKEKEGAVKRNREGVRWSGIGKDKREGGALPAEQ